MVVQLWKNLDREPRVLEMDGVQVRVFGQPQDMERWLHIREQAFATVRPAVRKWTESDFCAEISNRWWWSPERTGFAEVHHDPRPRVVGTVTLAIRRKGLPVVHWLAVIPAARRQGVARLLMAHLEKACWDQGYRQIALESEVGWKAAIACYQSLGYTSS